MVSHSIPKPAESAMKKTILIADDDKNIVASLKYLLSDEDFTISCVHDTASVIDQIRQHQVDLLLTDMNFHRDTTSGTEGIQLVKNIQKMDSELPIIVMTGWGTIDIAVEALKAGARDFIQKPWNDDQLLSAIKTQLRMASVEKKAQRLSQQNRLLNDQSHPQQREGIIAHSSAMQQLLSSLDELAQSDMSILLTGDNGTGKSMLAHYVHKASPRAEQSFVAVNMGAISENLFESEMFGHVKGAFTDAKQARVGRFEMAEGGSLFLDELANIPLSQQAKLLRVLEEQRFEQVGSSKTIQADVRLISATNANLSELIKQGQFRQDLFYRLNTVELRMPSLSERVDDIQPLAKHFLMVYSRKYNKACPSLTENAVKQMQQYDWPGNIRELSHLMERVLFTCKERQIRQSDLFMGHDTNQAVNDDLDMITLTLDEIEQKTLQQRLKAYDGNVTETARSLGLSRSAYYRRANKYELD